MMWFLDLERRGHVKRGESSDSASIGKIIFCEGGFERKG